MGSKVLLKKPSFCHCEERSDEAIYLLLLNTDRHALSGLAMTITGIFQQPLRPQITY